MTTTIERPTSVELRHFDEAALDLYWRFVAERQRVFVRRYLLGMSFPWTNDPILQSEFITNNYRELDPGTQYVMTDIVNNQNFMPADVVFNVMMYRVMGSVPATHRLVTSTVEEFDTEQFITTLRERVTTEQMKVFGDAYRVASYTIEGGSDKIENVGRMFGRFAETIQETMRRLRAATEPQEAFDVFLGIKGFGEFLAYQVTVDLLYKPVDEEPVLPWGTDEWAYPGPGARKGIWALLRADVKPQRLQPVMHWLRDNQREEFAKRDIEFPYLLDEEGNEILISLCNIQSTLCEYFKYQRLWSGERQAVRRYDPRLASSDVPPFTAVALEDIEQLRDLEPCLTPLPSTNEHPGRTSLDEAQEVDEDEEEDLDFVPNGRHPVQQRGSAASTTQSIGIDVPGGGRVEINITINVGPQHWNEGPATAH